MAIKREGGAWDIEVRLRRQKNRLPLTFRFLLGFYFLVFFLFVSTRRQNVGSMGISE